METLILVGLCLGVTVAIKEGNGTSLRVLEPERKLDEVLKLTCSGMEGDPHTLARVSWVLITGNEEEQLDAREANELELSLSSKRNGANVACRSHVRSSPQLVALATPPLRLRIANLSYTEPQSYRVVTAQIGQTEGGPLRVRVGETIEVVCKSVNLPHNHVIYNYILQQNDAGDVEKELGAAIPNDTRFWRSAASLTVREADQGSRVLCLARWFKEAHYRRPIGLRSEPILLIVEPGQDYTYLWVAVGVGALGWLAAVTSLCALCCRQPRNLTAKSSDPIMVLDEGSNEYCCVNVVDRHSVEPRGATVLPAARARSLAAANIKLSPLSAAARPPAPALYANVEELNSLARRHGPRPRP